MKTTHYEAKTIEHAQAELFAVFFEGGRAWEEPVLFMGTFVKWESVTVEGEEFCTEPKEFFSTVSDAKAMDPDCMRKGFVGLRPVAMPRDAFAKQHLHGDIARQRYLTDVTDAWSVADPDGGDA